MVTTTPENVFQKLIQRDRWDLKDMKKKDEWLLRTGTLLHKAGVAVALKNGRPTIAKIKAVQPKLGLRTMQVMLENLVQVYEEQISVAFDVLVNRLDLSDAWLCSEVTRHMGTRDGQAVWDLIQKECDMSTGVKQDAVVSKWEHFSIPANVSPVQLREYLSVMYMLFTQHGAYSHNLDDVSPLVRKALRVLPQTGPFAGFASTLRGLLATDKVLGLFATWDSFVDVVVEHFAAAHAAAGAGGQLAALADGGAPPLTSARRFSRKEPGPDQCKLCPVFCCPSSGTNKRQCICFNKTIKIPDSSSPAQCLHVHAGRAYLSEHPECQKLWGAPYFVKSKLKSAEEYMKIYKSEAAPKLAALVPAAPAFTFGGGNPAPAPAPEEDDDDP